MENTDTRQINEESLDEMLEKSFWRDILYEIIKNMDPWDLDICELATRYSMKIEQMKEMNFRIPANVVIVSAVLLRMKSQFIKFSDEEEIDLYSPEFTEDLGLDEGLMQSSLGLSLSNTRLKDFISSDDSLTGDLLLVKPKRVPKRRITALELIAAIQEVLEDKAFKSRVKDVYSGGLTINLNRDLTHLIEETYCKVMDILAQKKEAVFSELAHTRDEKVLTFISLLHLSNKQKIKLRQEKIFEELYIHL